VSRVTTPSVAVFDAGIERDLVLRRTVRTSLLLLGIMVAAFGGLAQVRAESLVPGAWPAAGLCAGLLLTSTRSWRRWLAPGLVALLALTFVAHGYSLLVSFGFALSSVAGAWVVRERLVAGRDGARAALLDQGDVSKLIGAITVGSAATAAGCALTAWASGNGNPLLGLVAAFGAVAAANICLLPLFMETLEFEALAGVRERVVQFVITLGTTVAVFLFAGAPPVVFAVMPMFAWHAFRGTLREATVLLTVVGVIGTGLTFAGIGPIWGLEARYDLAPELVNAVLQLFLLDCGLILLPLSVMVTQQRIAANRAEAERVTLHRLVSSAAGTAVVATGPDGRITIFNPAAEAMFGVPEAEALDALPDTLFGDEELKVQAAQLRSLPNFADVCRASVALGELSRLWRVHGRDGTERTLRIGLSPVLDERGRLAGYLATGEDVTEREAAHHALTATLEHERAARDRIQELERVKGDFVSTVSHELRTPITSIVGYTELLEDGMVGDLTEEQADIVGRIDRNGRRLLALVEDLLTLSQIESSRLKIEPVSIDVRRVLGNAHRWLSQQLEGRDLEVHLALPADPHVLEGDPVQLERMVRQLLSNAVKFTPDGGRVEVELCQRSDHTEIVVRDSGVGIPEADQEQLFNRFYRTTSAYDQAIQGAGLGLTIVRAIVALHGGAIHLDSTPQQGTTVSVTLPRTALAVPA
jgi:PAS domain S-box-containing protein